VVQTWFAGLRRRWPTIRACGGSEANSSTAGPTYFRCETRPIDLQPYRGKGELDRRPTARAAACRRRYGDWIFNASRTGHRDYYAHGWEVVGQPPYRRPARTSPSFPACMVRWSPARDVTTSIEEIDSEIIKFWGMSLTIEDFPTSWCQHPLGAGFSGGGRSDAVKWTSKRPWSQVAQVPQALLGRTTEMEDTRRVIEQAAQLARLRSRYMVVLIQRGHLKAEPAQGAGLMQRLNRYPWAQAPPVVPLGLLS